MSEPAAAGLVAPEAPVNAVHAAVPLVAAVHAVHAAQMEVAVHIETPAKFL